MTGFDTYDRSGGCDISISAGFLSPNTKNKRKFTTTREKFRGISIFSRFFSLEFVSKLRVSRGKLCAQDMVVAFMEQCREGVRDVGGPL